VAEITPGTTRNALLSTLSGSDFALLRPHLKRVVHRSGDVLAAAGGSMDRICFPEGGVAAFLAIAAGGHRAAAGLVGYEGLIGVGSLLGQTRWSHEVLLRGEDSSMVTIETGLLLDACRQSSTLNGLLLRFAGILMLQFARTGTANLVSQLERRMARWILLYHDRLEGDEFPMTHEEIGIMLGVRRASATDILHILEGERAIHNARGRLIIRDRARLEEIAGDTYGEVEATYRTLIGPFGKGNAATPGPVAARLE
jgi:CRP-like cAMP-binding protein